MLSAKTSLPPLGYRLMLICMGLTLSVRASATDRQLADLSIEELLNESVTSVSKKETKLSESATAITVISADDISRSGMTMLPEVLRTVPGMDVARISANEWAVTARGFNSALASKLLVLMDGRTVYTPNNAGVFWNAQDTVLEDLDRIEVIRGPGATLWGANAVNGVINITSKKADETQGALIAGAFGSEDRPTMTARYGGKFSDDFHYRVYAKYFNRDHFDDAAGNATPDAWHTGRGGFRADWTPTSIDSFTLQGDYYRGEATRRVNLITLAPVDNKPSSSVSPNRGSNVIAHWTHDFSSDSQLTLQSYYDHVQQGDGFGIEYRNTYDIELQHRFKLNKRHDLVWGTGYRYAAINNTSSFNLTWTPAQQQLRLFNWFLQDEITLVPDRWHATLGSKFEHYTLSGWHAQPSARLAWTPNSTQTVWSAVSRAIRTPSRFEEAGRFNLAAVQPPNSLPLLLAVVGNTQIAAEKLTAYELGYRIEPLPQLSFDIATFYNVHDDAVAVVTSGTQFEANPAPAHLLVSYTWQNALSGHTYGGEFAANWQALRNWRISGSYSQLRMQLHSNSSLELNSPQHQFQVHSSLDLPANLQLNSAVYYVGTVATQSGGVLTKIPAYARLDVGATWQPTPALQLGLWLQNAQSRRHAELDSQGAGLLTQVPRSVTAHVTGRF